MGRVLFESDESKILVGHGVRGVAAGGGVGMGISPQSQIQETGGPGADRGPRGKRSHPL